MRHLGRCLLAVSLLMMAACERGEQSLETDGWRVRPGFDPAWLTAPPAEGWEPLKLPAMIRQVRGFADHRGYVTLQLEAPSRIEELFRQGEGVAINSGRTLDVSYYYINDRLIGQRGSDAPYRPGAMRPFLRDIPANALRSDRPNYLSIVLFNDGSYPLQLMDPIEVGRADRVYLTHTAREILAFVLLTLYFVSGAYHLLLYARRPKDRYNLYFGLGAIVVAGYWFVGNTYSRDFVFGDAVELHRRVEHMLLFAVGPLFFAFLTQYATGRLSRVGVGYAAFAAVAVIATAFVPLSIMRLIRDVTYGVMILSFIYLLFFIGREIYRGNREAWYLAAGLVLLVAGGLHDMVQSKGLLPTPKLAHFTFVAFVGGLAGMMATRFMRVTNSFEELNRDLENKVQERTRELQQSLTEVRALKEQQDGDYFLTSLLLQPLGGVYAQSETVEVEALIRQKKRFRFRHREAEIGGDLCVADSLRLGGRQFTVFLNGDAMGKSIQGAGGAIVLGTVFRSILTRTRIVHADAALSPEQWLERCYRELQAVFTSFDGVMLISLVLGLVDDATGQLYLINAEHPWPTLVRNGVPGFIRSESWMYKVGVQMEAQRFEIVSLRLEPGDALIVGSDGRDDLLLGQSAEGRRILNEDEEAFLRRVEESGGRLPALEQALLRTGELTDDLSLMRISYREQEVGVAAPESLEELRNVIRGRLRERNYNNAAELAASLLDHGAADEESLFLAAYALKLGGQRDQARQVSERLHLRNPRHTQNLVNLADLLRLSGERERADQLLQSALQLDPENKAALRLRELLSG